MKRFTVILVGVVFFVDCIGQSKAEWSFVGLGTLGGPRSYAYDLSADGSVAVGFSDNAFDNDEAFRWKDNDMVRLGTLGGSSRP